MTRFAVVAILLIAGCTQLREPRCPVCPPAKAAPERAQYTETSFAALPGWNDEKLEPSLRAFMAGCPRASGPFVNACALASMVTPGDESGARRFFETNFVPYAVSSSETGDSGLVTGYYEPILRGSRTRSPAYAVPIFGVPPDLLVVDLATVAPEVRNLRLRGRLDGRRVVPYFTRGEISARGETFPAPVLAWAADPVEVFFLQIQGSGQIELDGGERIRLGFAEQNGHPYRSLGRYLVDRGALTLDQASMQGIKAWASANPEKLADALNVNASYVFFRELTDARGPVGALGTALVPQYSLAVDRRYFPLGSPVYLATIDQPFSRLMSAHDTGGAIRGIVRADFFWGTGPDAGASAGSMRQNGRMWLLWPRGEPLPRSD